MAEIPPAIIHLDLDAFYAAVEVLLDPELEGKPVVIGGRQRGVVAAASYPARKFGIHSAMPMFQALKLNPDIVVIPPRHRLYSQYSRQVMAILEAASPAIEQISIDEACLDLTDRLEAWDDVISIAKDIQRQVREKVGLSASLGVATNKLVAKVASDRDKPGGLTVVRPGEEAQFLAPLPVRVLWGVGPVTADRLNVMGVTTVGQLAELPEGELAARFGIHGKAMKRHAQGIDRRKVAITRERKSISQERTFDRDISDLITLKKQLWKMSQSVAKYLDRGELTAGTVAIKVRYSDFTTFTRQMSLAASTSDPEEIYGSALALLQKCWQTGRPVRLLGVGGHDLAPPSGQMTLW